MFDFVIRYTLHFIAVLFETSGVVAACYSLAVLIPFIAVTVRRFHDIGYSGAWGLLGWALLTLLPILIALGVFYTPLFIGALLISPVVVFVAMDSEPGENRYGPNPKGKTPLHLAADKGQLDTVKELVATGADVNARNNEGYTPLHLATNKGQLDTVKELVATGADVNARNNEGYTPLHRVAWSGPVEVVKILAATGADVNANDNLGRTPLDYAGKAGATYNVLRDAGGRHNSEL